MAETHQIVIQKPKPQADELLRLTAEYFNARGKDYDQFEAATAKRDLFTDSVDRLIGTSLSLNSKIKNVLSVACGTGRREIDISKYADRNLTYTGVEISHEMAELSRQRGFFVVEGSWPDVEIERSDFDAALVLSAFGHVPSEAHRIEFLTRISEVLSPEAPLFFDVLSLNDRNEWGPRIQEIYKRENLKNFGFDEGDVLYQKIGEPEICFYHYFTEEEIWDLLNKSGFEFFDLKNVGYGTRFGEIVESGEGAFLVQAKRKKT